MKYLLVSYTLLCFLVCVSSFRRSLKPGLPLRGVEVLKASAKESSGDFSQKQIIEGGLETSLPSISFILPQRHNDNRPKVRVNLVGVIHGSPSSSDAVTEICSRSKQPDMIILELCDRRLDTIIEDYNAIEKSISKSKEVSNEQSTSQKSHSAYSSSSLGALAASGLNSLRSSFSMKEGFLYFLLNLLNSAQSLLKIIPGCEFIEAVRQSRHKNITMTTADMDVEEILKLMKESTNPASIFSLVKNPSLLLNTCNSLGFSILGNKETNSATTYSIPHIFFTNPRFIKDIFLLMSPTFLPIIIAYGFIPDLFSWDPQWPTFTFPTFIPPHTFTLPTSTLPTLMTSIPSQLAPLVTASQESTSEFFTKATDVLTNLLTVYLMLTVINVSRFVVLERDKVLAQNVLRICEDLVAVPKGGGGTESLASSVSSISLSNTSSDDIQEVVVVLGMLHCNGVAKYLRNGQQ